ncbi:class I SAM-dependent methyltransferase [Sphingobacterium psychroaquaticum]|uniref:Methyltransferase domain-containing protein n=1 Tax=Sphingobacterium psychroaquaticum TaxID=561061 RepID=A0A1X7I2K5_9SPHI|nr:class I SAM-dependent methyltransferase [Sphingobacterium psychroaquaticum]SMG08604.1 Methyltransferase domain-containing protein [Sphingobacterium psychroaquaticum]
MEDIDKLKEIADQLRMPTGKKGEEMALMMQTTNANMTQHAVAHLHVGDGDTVLELGHGNADHITPLLKKYSGTTYHGLEISDLMQQAAQHNNQLFVDQGRAQFTVYDGQTIPYATETFHKILTVNTIYFWKDPLNLLQELHRVLKLNGLLAITFGLKQFMSTLPFTAFGFQLYDAEDIEKLALHVGFHIQAVEEEIESVKSKTGELVNRRFATVLLRK